MNTGGNKYKMIKIASRKRFKVSNPLAIEDQNNSQKHSKGSDKLLAASINWR